MFGENHNNIHDTFYNIGVIFFKIGDYKKAIEYLYKDLSIEKVLYGESHKNLTSSLCYIGWIYKEIGQNDKALEYYEK